MGNYCDMDWLKMLELGIKNAKLRAGFWRCGLFFVISQVKIIHESHGRTSRTESIHSIEHPGLVSMNQRCTLNVRLHLSKRVGGNDGKCDHRNE